MNFDMIVVGCGNMGHAILERLVSSGQVAPGRVRVVEPDQGLRARAALLGVEVAATADDLPATTVADVVLLAVKPQVMAAALPAYRAHAPRATFVSIAAGVPLAALAATLGAETALVRAMPNMPVSIGEGTVALVGNAPATGDRIDGIARLLQSCGHVHVLGDEGLLDAVTAVSGSGPAYFFHMIEVLARAGEDLGLPPGLSLDLARETMRGASGLAIGSPHPPAELRRQVTSPNGTTAAALDRLEPRLGALVHEAVLAAHARARELAG